ncbi:MAG: cyclic nucleotide-binding domain-containing protein [Elusimicrobiota bacterium]|nr:cyclic nucleotide-binding domain-containing protein [Elusimicrobiota bacterium]
MKDILDKTKIFKGLSETELKEIKKVVKKVKVKEGKTVFNKGEAGGQLYIVHSGAVDIFVIINMEWGPEEIQLARLNEGAAVGELSFFDGQKRSASAKTFIDSQLLTLDKKDYDRLVEKNKGLGLKILTNAFKLVSKRLRISNTNVSDMARNLYFY